jgi:hypothetical protein
MKILLSSQILHVYDIFLKHHEKIIIDQQFSYSGSTSKWATGAGPRCQARVGRQLSWQRVDMGPWAVGTSLGRAWNGGFRRLWSDSFDMARRGIVVRRVQLALHGVGRTLVCVLRCTVGTQARHWSLHAGRACAARSG